MELTMCDQIQSMKKSLVSVIPDLIGNPVPKTERNESFTSNISSTVGVESKYFSFLVSNRLSSVTRIYSDWIPAFAGMTAKECK